MTGYYRYKMDEDKNQVQIQMKSITSTPWCFDIEFYNQTATVIPINMVYYTEKDLSIVGEGNRIDLFCVSTYDRDANPTQIQTKFQSIDTALNTDYKPIDNDTLVIKCSGDKPLYIGSLFGVTDSTSEEEANAIFSSTGSFLLPWDTTTNQIAFLAKFKKLKANQFLYSQNERSLSNVSSLFDDVEYTQITNGAKYKKAFGLAQVEAPINTCTGFVIERHKRMNVVYDRLYFIVYNS